MAECVPPSAAELTRQLEAYSASRGHPSELVQLLRAPRLGLRSSPAFRSTYGAHAPFWPALASAWQVDAHRLSRDDGDDDHEDSIPAILALAAFLLSLCTQEPHNQQQAVTYIEPSLRKVLLVASSLFNLEDSAYTDMTRVCCQALANLVTDNQPLASSFFPQRLDLELDDNLIQRLLASPDHGTLQAVLIFLLNSIHGSRERALLLGTGKAGAAILDRLMTIVSVLFEDETAEGIASEEFHSDIFQLSFAIVQQLIELEAFAPAYEEHALMPGFATSPTLVTLLKFLDGHLSSSPPRARTPAALSLAGFLARQLAHLGAWLVDEGEGAQRVRNAADAAAVQGVVLVLHCLCSVGMALEERGGEGEGESGGEEEEEEKAREEMAEGVEAAVRLLRFSTTLLPPPSARPPPPSSSSSPTPNPPPPSPSQEATPALAQLQRTLVQFLAVVSFSPPLTVARPTPSPRVRRAQDRVRELGGLEVLLSLCQMDERNTTMREHALFALRNLLKSNQASQDYVDAMRPQYRVGEGGELLDLPPPLRKE